eukprot:08553.XXX_43819_43920_1 [CDS] Oithona nana genome sequencing.
MIWYLLHCCQQLSSFFHQYFGAAKSFVVNLLQT